VRTIGALWGIETVSLRVFNAYGPGQHLPPSHPPVVPNFLRQAVRGGSLVVHGDGNQTRDFIYVGDVVRAMVAAATAPSVDSEVINVGSGVETSVRELVSLIMESTKSDAEVLYTPRNDPGVSRMCADLALARSKLSFIPMITLEKGLQLTQQRDARFQKGASGSLV
jgi:UDP-glucose 4-epimerase